MISYQPPAPVGAFAALSRNQIGRQQGGVSLSEQYAAEMQAKQAAGTQQALLMARDREHGDQMTEQRQQFAAQQAFSPRDEAMVRSQAAAQAAAQQDRVQGQMQLNQAELTQQENMRLQRLKQGEDAIKQQITDGTVTKAEGMQMLSQLRTPIQVFEARKAASQVQHQDMQNQALKQQIEMQRSVEIRKNKDDEERLAYSAAAIGKKLEYRIDEQQATTLRAKYASEFPGLPPAEIEAAVKEELIGQGHFTTWYPDEKGVPTLAKDHPHGTQSASSGGGGGTSSRGGKGGVPEFDPSRAYHDAESAVDKLLAAGTIKPEDAQAEIAKRVEARKAFHGSYVGEKQSAATVGHPAPFNPNDLATGTDSQKAQVVKLKDQFAMLPKLGLPPMVEFKASQDISTAIKLVGQYADKDGRMDGDRVPPIVKRQLAAINKRLSALTPPQEKPTLPAGPLTLEQKQALAQKLQDRAAAPAAPAAPAAQPTMPGHVWIPASEAVNPRTGERTPIPGRFVRDMPAPEERTHEKGLRYFQQGLDRLRKSATGEGPPISFGDY